ncbi:MAG: hypothetical protein [Podoviridae sp. ctrTa16]|nr:MAG: hypothetical protein [Podoviridae sp. ctrTa16]
MSQNVPAEKQRWFSKGISVGELIGYAITVLVILGSAWKNIDTRLLILEQQQIRQNDEYNEIKSDLKLIRNAQQEILVTLQNKEDRK